MEAVKHLYEVRPRSDKRGVDLISDVLPFGRLSKCEGGVLASGGREGTPVETLHKAQEQLQHEVSEN
jgi:hypothetical protein